MDTPAHVALATTTDLPEPDVDEALLTAALQLRGLAPEVVAWDDPTIEWSNFHMVVVRSTWDYHHRHDEFLSWAREVASVSQLWNPADVIAANAHKGYLLELAQHGVPVVPTVLLPRGDATPLSRVMEQQGWQRAVVKPAVSAGSWATVRVEPGTVEEGEAHLRRIAAERDVLVQPYLSSVEAHGERALVWIDGELTHSVRKTPRFAGDHEAVSDDLGISEAEREIAGRALATVQQELLYARIDVAPDEDGRLLLMELELIEPSLFLAQSPRALDRFADAIAARAGTASRQERDLRDMSAD